MRKNFGGEDSKSQPLKMKKDKKKKKKTAKEKRGEPNGTGESLTDSLQGAPKKMHHSDLYPISVLEVAFYFFTCVL